MDAETGNGGGARGRGGWGLGVFQQVIWNVCRWYVTLFLLLLLTTGVSNIYH